MLDSPVKDRLHQFHRAYLTTRGVSINNKGRWKCFVHEDTAPSCNFVPGTEERLWHCHGCGVTSDIFDSCHYLEGRPQNGVAWFKETFCYLAAEFNVEVPRFDRELTPEEEHEMLVDRAFERAARLVLSMQHSDMVRSKLADYGWSPVILRSFGIGGVTSFSAYVEEMDKAGFSLDFLKDIGLADYRIFREQSLIFTIKDHNGRPIAFAGRNLLFEQEVEALEKLSKESLEYSALESKHAPKYVNTAFAKGQILFGFHLARGNSSLYVFEGNADCVTAHNLGLLNSVAVCGARFNEKHLQLSLENGVRHFICCFDSDNGGQGGKEAFAEFFDKQLEARPDVRAELIDLPAPDGQKVDPDVFMRRNGLKAFRDLPRRSYFYWNAKKETRDRVTVAGEYVRKILLQPDPLMRYDMLCQLSEATTLPRELLFESALQQASRQDSEIAKQVVAAGQRLLLFKEQPAQVKAALTGVSPAVEKVYEPVRKIADPAPKPTAAPVVKLVPARAQSDAERVNQAAKANAAAAEQWK